LPGELVKVTYAPIRELVVHEVIEQDQTTFFEDVTRDMLASPVHVEPTINWVDGFALLIAQLPPTDEIVADNLRGKVHYQAVLFTRMAYQSKIAVRLGNQDYTVRLRKADNNPNLVDLVSFLKDLKTEDRSQPNAS
jgi:hypothetical protein